MGGILSTRGEYIILLEVRLSPLEVRLMQMSHQSDHSLLDISDCLSLSLVIHIDLLFLLPSTNDAVHYDPQTSLYVSLTGGINGGENSGSEWLHVASVVLIVVIDLGDVYSTQHKTDSFFLTLIH